MSGKLNSGIIYHAHYNTLFNESTYVIITDTSQKILQVLDSNTFPLLTNSFECDVHKTKHRLGDNFNTEKCGSKFPNSFDTFTNKSELINFLAKIGNRGAWAGHKLRLDSDNDGELVGVYKEGYKIYSGWVLTHRDTHIPRPRKVELINQPNVNDKIEVILDNEPETGNIIITYKDNVAYAFPDVYNEIYIRILPLLN